MRFLVSSLLLLFFSTASSAYPDSLQAVECIDLSISQIKNLAEDSVAIYPEQCFQRFKENDDLDNWLTKHRALGKAWRDQEDFQKSLNSFNKGLEGIWRKPQNKSEYTTLAWLYANIGWVYYAELNELNLAKKYYQMAGSIFTDTLKIEDANVAKHIYKVLGNICSGLRDIENSRYYHGRGLNIFRDLKDWDELGEAYSNTAEMYIGIEDYTSAESVLLESLELLDKVSFDVRMLLLPKTGLNYAELENYQQAIKYTDRAKKLLDQERAKLSKEEMADDDYELNYNYGFITERKGDFEKAEKHYQKALDIHTKRKGRRRQFAIIHFRFGSLYLDWNKLDLSKQHYQKAITYIIPEKDTSTVDAHKLIPESNLSFAYRRLALVALEEYKQSQNKSHLETSVKYYGLANKVDQLILENYAGEGTRLTALAKQRELKEASLDAFYQLWQIDPKAIWKEKMFELSENSRAFLQLESIQLSQNMDNWDQVQRQIYAEQTGQLAKINTAIYDLKKRGKEFGDSAVDSLTSVYLKLQERMAQIRKEQTKTELASSAKLNENTIPLKEIQKTLSKDQVLLEYFVGAEHLFLFCLSKNDFLIYRKAIPANFHQTIDKVRSIILNPNDDFNRQEKLFSQNAWTLYDYLLKDVLADLPQRIKRLVIIRDADLNLLPFDILLTEEVPDTVLYFEMPYLIREYGISYAASASLFHLQQHWEKGRAESLFAGYAPKYETEDIATEDTVTYTQFAQTNRDSIGDLPGAKKEVEAVSALLQGHQFIGADASEDSFKKTASNYRILLLSMHGLLNWDNPDFSKLLFTEGVSGAEEDDELNALELHDLQLNADLAVLSACETGYGKLHPGEGMMSLSRAFLLSGVPSTVMSLWQVEDELTSKVVISFFTHLKKGLTKEEALRQAKLNFLTDLEDMKVAHPYYWAGLIQVGNNSALDLSSNSWCWCKLLGILLLLLLIFFLYKFFK